MVKKVVLSILILYLLGAVALNSPLFSLCVISPSRKIDPSRFDAIQGARRQRFVVRSGTEQLEAWFFEVKGSTSLAVVHHGRGGNLYNKAFLAQQLIDRNLSVVVYDYCGYGASSGPASLNSFNRDALAVHDFSIVRFGFAPAKTVIVGESIGTGPACAVASQRECAGVFLQAPFTSLPQEAKSCAPILHVYPDWLFPKPSFENIQYVRGKHPPLLIVHGAKDNQIPVSHAKALFEAATQPTTLVILPNAGHRNVGGADPELFGKALTEFLNEIKN